MGVKADETSRTQEFPAADAALQNGHRELALWLLERSSQLSQHFQGQTGCLMLNTAIEHDDLEIVKWLIEHGVDVNANFGGSSPYTDAQSDEMRSYLRSVGAVNFHPAKPPPDLEGGHEEIIEFLDAFGDSDGYWGNLLDWTLEFPGDPRIEMHCLEPSEDHNRKLLFTVGMSDVVLSVPHDMDVGLELALALPADWPLEETNRGDLPFDTPMTMLHNLASQLLNKGSQTFLYEERDRSGPEWSLEVNSEFPSPVLPSITFCGYLLLPVDGLTLSDDRRVVIYHTVPLYAEEIEFVRQRNHFEPLLLRFVEMGIQRILDFSRPNAVADWPEGKPEPEIDDSCSL